MTSKERLHEIIFGWDTPAGKKFDIILIVLIGLSVLVVMLDSVATVHGAIGDQLYLLEWGFTILFTLEYFARLYAATNALRYARSFFGLVDLLAILPTYASLFVVGAQYATVVRLLRVLRIFRVLKYAKYIRESETLMRALYASRRKIIVFLFFVLTVTTIVGAMMYIIEGEESGFTSIPEGMYWAIVTLTTVGYGDIRPITPFGQALAAMMMILGYAIIAVPTGIVTVEMSRASRHPGDPICAGCGAREHDSDARYCRRCGVEIKAVAE